MDTYEKKYKEALEKARQLCAYPTTKPFISDLQDLFPELTESNDERIRKELIDAILGLWDNDALPMPLSVKRKDEWIAWLEKQEEPELSEDLGEYVAELSKQFPEVSFAKLSRIAVRVKNWFEKQDEQKFEMESPEESLGISSEEYNDIVNECLYGESNSSNKIEPKFHEGDWVVNKLGNLWHIDSFDKKNYQVSDGKGNYNYFPISKQDRMHLWTIQDAKDGDVLYCKSDCGIEFIVMSKGINNRNNIDFYFRYNSDDGFGIDIPNVFSAKQDNITPATKEQRDILFKKMKEAGFEWDSEKKELKKISQRMISAKAKEAMYDKPTDNDMVEALRTEYEKGRADAFSLMQKEWSEEDEEFLRRAINAAKDIYPMTANWLKSLKDKIIPQSKQE